MIGLSKQTNCNRWPFKDAYFIWKERVQYAVEEEVPFLCQLDCSLTLLDVALRWLNFDATRSTF